MTVKCLTANQKDLIATWYKQRLYSQLELAKQYGVSERTINRVLEEKGLATPIARLKGDAYQVMQVLAQYGMNVEQLKVALAAPALNFENVQLFLNRCTKQQLAELFYTSGLVMIGRMTQEELARAARDKTHVQPAG